MVVSGSRVEAAFLSKLVSSAAAGQLLATATLEVAELDTFEGFTPHFLETYAQANVRPVRTAVAHVFTLCQSHNRSRSVHR